MAGSAVPEPTDVLDASAALFAQLSQRIPGFHGLVASDVILSAIGLPIARVNAATSARFAPGRAEGRIDDVMTWFDELGLPFAWRIGPRDRPKDLEARLRARGFTVDPDEMPGMAAPMTNLPSVELPAGASVEVVEDAATYGAWLAVLVEGFGMPSQIGTAYERFAGLGFGAEIPVRLVLARVDGEAAAVALGAIAGGGVTIVNVTTLERFRGRGLGRAVTLEAMRLAATEGARVAVLQSTDMGFSVYQRLGFESFGRFRTLVWDPAGS